MTTHFAKITFGSGESFEFTTTDPRFILELDGVPIVGLQHVEDGGAAIGIYDGENHEHFKTLEVITVPEGKAAEEMTFDELLKASSLGSPEAWQIRQTLSPAEQESLQQFTDEFIAQLHERSMEKEDYSALMDDGLQKGADELNTDLESMKIWSPWSPEQIYFLNVFQARGNFHPFTCPEHPDQLGQVKLEATTDGWVCSQGCGYTQDWAWLAMTDPQNWLTPHEMGSLPEGCMCTVLGDDHGWRILQWNERCEVHPQLKGSHLDPAKNGTQMALASRPLHMGGGEVMREVGVPNDECSDPEFHPAHCKCGPRSQAEFDLLMAKGQPVDVEVELKKRLQVDQATERTEMEELRKEGE